MHGRGEEIIIQLLEKKRKKMIKTNIGKLYVQSVRSNACVDSRSAKETNKKKKSYLCNSVHQLAQLWQSGWAVRA